ncbi:MAG: TonB-dependent receptor plug domain-containing protein [Woeseiaceae bacterium]
MPSSPRNAPDQFSIRHPRKLKVSMTRFLCALGLLASSHANAQSVIDEIQVTATRRDSSVTSIPTPVSIIDQSKIETATLVTDALAFAPGVLLQETTPGQGAAIVRGLKGSEVLHLVDGIRLNNAIFRSAPTQYVALVPGASVQRIEVLRGSAAALYGSDAVGGVINMITRKPEFSDSGSVLRGDALLSANSADTLRATAATIEAAGEDIAGLLSFDAMRTSDRRIGGGERIRPSGFEAFGFRAAVRQKLSASTIWFADAQLMRQPSTPRVDELNAGFGEDDAASDEFFFEPNQRTFLHVGADIDDGIFGMNWQLRSAWQRIDDDRRTRNRNAVVRTIESNRSDLFHVGATGSRDFEQGSWIIGAEWYHDAVASSRNTVDLLSGAELTAAPRFPDGSSLDQAAIFAQVAWTPHTHHTLTAGLRVTDLEADTNSPIAPALNNTDVSGELGWLMTLSDALSLTANIGRSFRAPNIFDLGASGARPGNRFNLPNSDLQPETAIQYDIGFRYQQERLQLNATLFRLNYRDRIASVPTGEQTTDGRDLVQNANVARAELTGIEVDAQYAFNESLTLNVVINAIHGVEFNPEREAADRIPPLNGQANLEWSTASQTRLSAGIQFAARQDRLSSRDLRDARINPEGTPGWLSLNAGVQHPLNDQWQLNARLENMLDKQFRIHGSGVDARGVNLSVQLRRSW